MSLTTRVRDSVGTYDDLHESASRMTGLSDFGDPIYEEGLRLLLSDYAQHAGLTGEGNYMQRTFLRGALVGRLLTVNALTRFPSFVVVPVERPIFVTGIPRSGTTALHRLLCADPLSQGLELWLTEYPQPRPPRSTWDADPIFAGISAAYAEQHVTNPEYMGIHYIDAASVEECWRLLRQAGLSNSYESLAHVPTYTKWLRDQDWTPAYEVHKQNLQLIGLNDVDKRWVLKNPSHLSALDAIMNVYPDALIVQTHRDPVGSIASSCSLSQETARDWSTVFHGSLIGQTQLDLWSSSANAFKEARTRYNPAQFIDIDYRDFVGNPHGTVESIYETFDLELTPAHLAAIDVLDNESKHGKTQAKHTYSLADYDLTEDEVRSAFR
ncbi:MAG TPA: sulfotransferase [Nocardioidaceae bacterium]|nr:sulfotransferase [Nocardioidaceae bacterium]